MANNVNIQSFQSIKWSVILSKLGQASKRGDLFFALGIVMLLVALILPMPTWLLDASLAASLTFSVMVLMTALFVEKPVDFSSFPTVLLIATLFRLALNLASSRLILAHGHEGAGGAGHVIEAFAGFVMSGNFVIGTIVFAILVIVNFVVITKGSTRIAEVAARFTLDAMPGKQMAIDADLSSGTIDEKTARKRRQELESESAFYGAMDGASKFVRGDAVAGLLITFVNVIGGMIIGMVQQNLPFSEAADFYTRLTVGDGLVTQIPALIVSVAAGMLVTKSGLREATDKALITQLAGYPKVLGMSSFLALSLALLPDMPMLPFIILALMTGIAAYYTQKHAQEALLRTEAEAQAPPPLVDEPISNVLRIDSVRLELGYSLLPMINNPHGPKLTDQIKSLRRVLAGEMGFVMPSVRIQDNMQLSSNQYVVYIKEVEAGKGELRPNMILVMDPRGDEITIPGELTKDPIFGLNACWVDPSHREEASFKGYTVVEPSSIITTHLTEIIKSYMAELLTYTETQKLLNEMEKESQKLITDLIPKEISLGNVQKILQNLLQERVSIRDLNTILEGIGEALTQTKNPQLITEHVRTRLARQISDANTNVHGYIPLITLSPEWEQTFFEALQSNGDVKLSVQPSRAQDFITKTRTIYEKFALQGEFPILLTGNVIRPYIQSMVDRIPNMRIVVMSSSEIHPKCKIKTLGQI